MPLQLEIDANIINNKIKEQSINPEQADKDSNTNEVNDDEEIDSHGEQSDTVSIGVQSDKNYRPQDIITKEKKKCKCCAEEGCSFDPSCDCWCCHRDLRYWCKVIGILEILIGIALGTIVFLFCIYLPRTQPPVSNNQNHLNTTRTTTKKPKYQSTFINPGAILLVDSYFQFYIILVCIGLLTIISACLILVGASKRKLWELSLFPFVEFLLIGIIVWAYLLTNTILVNAFYMYIIFFKTFFIIASIGLVTLIRKENYLNSIGECFESSKEIQLPELIPSTFDVYRPHGIIPVSN